MRLKTLFAGLLALLVQTFSAEGAGLPPVKKYSADIVIYGGTSAGVIAAYAAYRCGKSVLLVEPGKMLGGMTTGGLGQTDIGNKQAITGLSRQFYKNVGKLYGVPEQWKFEPSVASKVMEDYIRTGHIKVFYEQELTRVKKRGTAIQSLLFRKTGQHGPVTLQISGKEFMDCTYEGDLLAMAGVSFALGREDNKQYGETIDGVQVMHNHQFPDGVDPYVKPGDPSSGLLWGISADSLLPAGSGDKKIQAYNFRICLTDSAENRIPITRPENYDPARYELLLRLIAAQPGKLKLNDYFIWSRMPNRKTDINNRGAFSTDMIGMNYGWPEADYAGREKIFQSHVDYTKGLLYFIGHDPRVPDALRRQMLQWGYPKDEYAAFGHFTPELYIREGRRMIGEYVMTERNCRGKEKVTDGIGMAAYTMDSHNCERIVINGMVKNEGNVEVGGFPPYPVAYRSLTPKRSECTNLLVPVCLSASHIAYGSIRMEPVFMVLGQSAAMAASMAIDGKKAVQEIDVKQLQQRLQADPYLEKAQ
ncbi:FAD-dependent oxidoreductase [Compostibacter hankyongensis]|uniref:FAD-dependent oxidoreductase n=1 Tax=Compostibacter hankyongensis TaxID=1007089 RepID=A0ABP8FVE4_9BACT